MNVFDKFLIIMHVGIITSNADTKPVIRGKNQQFSCKKPKFFSFVHV